MVVVTVLVMLMILIAFTIAIARPTTTALLFITRRSGWRLRRQHAWHNRAPHRHHQAHSRGPGLRRGSRPFFLRCSQQYKHRSASAGLQVVRDRDARACALIVCIDYGCVR